MCLGGKALLRDRAIVSQADAAKRRHPMGGLLTLVPGLLPWAHVPLSSPRETERLEGSSLNMGMTYLHMAPAWKCFYSNRRG